MAVLEAREYREAQERLAADPIMIDMAGGLSGVAREDIQHDDGGPRGDFVMAARDEYARRGGKVASYGLGDYAKALIMLLDEKRSREEHGAQTDAKIDAFLARRKEETDG